MGGGEEMAEKISFRDVQVAVLFMAVRQGTFPWSTRMSVEEDLFKTFRGTTAREIAQAINWALKHGRVVSRGRFLGVEKKGCSLPPPPENRPAA